MTIKDYRLWTQSAFTIGATILAALALRGALVAPKAVGEPEPSPPAVSLSSSAYSPSQTGV